MPACQALPAPAPPASCHTGLRSRTHASASPLDGQRATSEAMFGPDATPFRSAFEHAATGMALVTVDGRFLRVNRSLCQIVGYSKEELQATDFQSLTHPDDLQADLDLAAQLFRGEIDHYHFEKRYFHKQGQVVWIQLSGSLVRDQGGQPCYAVAQIQDITSRKVAEQQSARRLRHLERLTESVSRILETLEGLPDAQMYPTVLRIVMESFKCPAGLFLRVGDNEALVGLYISEVGVRSSQCPPTDCCPLWKKAFRSGNVVVSNEPIKLGCGACRVARWSRPSCTPVRRSD